MMTAIETNSNWVKEILLCPIIASKHFDGIRLFTDSEGNKIILSGQKYGSIADEDMSDFAIGFYETVYQGLIPDKKLLKEDGGLSNMQFAGDTMNAKVYCGKDVDANSSWKSKYHCLANFWLLPVNVGRSSAKTPTDERKYSKSKNGINDFLDKFLKYYSDNYKEYADKYGDYVNCMAQDRDEDKNSEHTDIGAFYKNHCLLGSFVENDGYKIKNFSCNNKKLDINICEDVWNRIKCRAGKLAEECGEQLYEYFFKTLGLKIE